MSVPVGITVWLLSLFLMLISVSGVASSRVRCNSTGGGSCSLVQVGGHSSTNGAHGCMSGAGAVKPFNLSAQSSQQCTFTKLNTTKLKGHNRCSKEHVCDIQGLPHASSRATNVSVVFLPNSDCATFDLRVHWDNFHPDDLLRGYEVLLADDNDDNIIQCACQSSTTSRQVTFKEVYHQDNTYRVEVVSLPYGSRSSSSTVIRFKHPAPCTTLTYNQYCQGGGLVNHSGTWVTAETFYIMAGDNLHPQNTGQLLLQLTLSSVDHFLVALASSTSSSEAISSCYIAGRDPPCFIVKDTSSVIIYPLNASRKYNVYVESCTANACGPVSQVHSGHVCRSGNQRRCCNRGSYICMSGYRRCCNRVQSSSATSASTFIHLLPTSSNLVDPLGSPPTHPSASQSKHSSLLIIPTHIPKSPTGVTLQQETRTHETALLSTVLEVAGIHPTTTTTSWPAASSVLLPSAFDVSSSMAPVGPAVGGAVGIVAAVLFFTVTVVTLCRVILWKNRKTPNPTSNKHPGLQINNVSFLAYPGPPMPELPPPAPETCSEGFDPPLANIQPSSSSLSAYLVNRNPPLSSPTPDPPKLKHPCARSALIIYSPLCPDKDRRTLMQYLINDLREYDIRPVAHDCDYTKGSLSQWLETEVKRASAVLCVCDPAFQQEWEQQQPADTNFPLVYSLKLLVYANVNRGEELSKYAIVLLRKEDRNCIPTYYLNNTRTFYVNEIENIAHFVQQVPAYSYE